MKRSNAFGPRMLAAWEKATTPEGLYINCGGGEEGRKKAATLRYRLYSLRSILQKENYPRWTFYNRVSLFIKPIVSDDNKPEYILIGRSADYELEDILKEAGIEIPEAPALELE